VVRTTDARASALGDVIGATRTLTVSDWLSGAAAGVGIGVVVAVPTRVLPNEFFERMTPTRPQDYVFLVATALLSGLAVALRSRDVRVASGSIIAVFAVGCPICNKIVVSLLGTAGATSIFAPLQPLLGVVAVALVAFAVVAQARARCRLPSCGDV
jgi:hypothetical protein